MYKVLFNLTRKDCNFLRLSDINFTLSRTAPFATLETITPKIEKNIKDGLLIDVLGNTGVEINEELHAHNMKVLEYFNISTPTSSSVEVKVEATEELKIEDEVAVMKVSEPKKEEKSKSKKTKSKDSETK